MATGGGVQPSSSRDHRGVCLRYKLRLPDGSALPGQFACVGELMRSGWPSTSLYLTRTTTFRDTSGNLTGTLAHSLPTLRATSTVTRPWPPLERVGGINTNGDVTGS